MGQSLSGFSQEETRYLMLTPLQAEGHAVWSTGGWLCREPGGGGAQVLGMAKGTTLLATMPGSIGVCCPS